MLISESCQEPTPLTQERGNRMRRKRFQKGSLQTRKHGRHRVWVACLVGGRQPHGCKVLGRCSQMSKARGGISSVRDAPGHQQRRDPDRQAGIHVQAVCQRACTFRSAVAVGRNRPRAPRSRSSSRILIPEFGNELLHADPAGRIAGLSRPEGVGSFVQRGVPFAVVPERDFQARVVGLADVRAIRPPS